MLRCFESRDILILIFDYPERGEKKEVGGRRKKKEAEGGRIVGTPAMRTVVKHRQMAKLRRKH